MEYKTLESVAHFMVAEVRLSHYDDQFINNLLLYIVNNSAITSNQDALFRRVARKYERQFKHFNLDVYELLKLKWTCTVIESIPEYTNAHIMVNDDGRMIFRTPYKAEFLNALKKKPIQGLTWVREKRQYEMDFSPSALKQILFLSADYFDDMQYCPVVSQIVESVSAYDDAKYWSPTLVLNNGKFIVKACTASLNEAIKDIPLDVDLKTVAQLAQYGIEVDASVKEHFYLTEDRLKVDFASSFVTTFENRLLPVMFGWLKEFGCDCVGEFNPFKQDKGTLRADYVEELQKLGIAHKNNTSLVGSTCNNPVVLVFRGAVNMMSDKPLKLFKLVKCVNSEPVNLGPK